MTGYERIRAALLGRHSDKVPIMLHNFMMAAREYGLTMTRFREDPVQMAGAFIASIEKYGIDGIMIDMDTVTMAGALGVPIDFPDDSPARSNAGCLHALEDVDSLPEPDVENYRYVQHLLEVVRRVKAYFGDEIFVRGNCDQAPFSLASMVRGSEEWLMDLAVGQPDYVHQLLDYCTSACRKLMDLMAQTGADMLSHGDSPAGPDLISPSMYAEFALPYEKQMAGHAQKHGLPYGIHICGDTELILEQMIGVGADLYELDYKTDVHSVYRALSKRAVFIGNIDPSGVLALGSVDKVVRSTQNLLAVYGHANRFILNAGCAIPPDTPSDNIRAMVATARAYR